MTRHETAARIARVIDRYPTPRERLVYVRQAYRRWSATAGRVLPSIDSER